MKLTGRSLRLVIGWLTGLKIPFRNDDIDRLAQGLGVSQGWLLWGQSHSFEDEIYLQWYRSLGAYEKTKERRLMLRLLNKDPKATRLLKMWEDGKISQAQVWSMV